MTQIQSAEHFHAVLHISVPCFDPRTLAEVSEVLARATTGLAIAHGVEPIASIDWPHSHAPSEDDDA